MKVLIIEDEELAVRKLQRLINETDSTLHVEGVTTSIADSVSWLKTHAVPDVIFMDIELADGQCFEIFEYIDIHSRVIFTTSYDEYALQAFRVNSIDYLLKPIQQEDLGRSIRKLKELSAQTSEAVAAGPSLDIEKLLRELQDGHTTQAQRYRKRFLVKQGAKQFSVEVAEIMYFYSDEKISFFRTLRNQKFLVDYTIDELAALLDPEHFFQLNRGLIVTHHAIENVQPYFGNRLALTLKPAFEREAVVSRERVKEFKTWMGR
ncbi:LytR/AlgR family response regulator transcription factor [Dyadobacter sandarakinus]|uniref:Response regulator transcription factor n=1 Tax=Dyadobacter sandarakinus TaxID=2747268 RepID=A0ABX7I193_9BACT|nr:LytTR family DNA-binding domain-containing protein [Dyadobacter sandarakinus]QRQ99798.1 response regulator transcription factor [Dyadobacter sandarakinus]